jgi:hypothetical protein
MAVENAVYIYTHGTKCGHYAYTCSNGKSFSFLPVPEERTASLWALPDASAPLEEEDYPIL